MIRLHPDIAALFGFAEIPDAMLADCVKRAKLRCSNVKTTLYRRRPLQRMMIAVAKEAIADTFNDYFPNSKRLISNSWPWANCTIKGNSARVEIWIGQDYDEGDGIEPFDIVIKRADDFSIKQIIQAMLKPTKVEPKHEPELLLAKPEPAPPPPRPDKRFEPTASPPPPPKAQSRGRSILDR